MLAALAAVPLALQLPMRGGFSAHSSGDACHLLGNGESAWLCDNNECIPTSHMTLCTDPSEQDGMRCVLQEGLLIEGQPVWACAPMEQPHEITHGHGVQVPARQVQMSLRQLERQVLLGGAVVAPVVAVAGLLLSDI